MLGAALSYQLVKRDLTQSLAVTAKQQPVARASADYLSELSKVTSVEEFLSNDKVYRYAMKAYGLEDMTYAKAFMRKVLDEGIDDTKSFANTLTDQRYKAFAEAFNFERYGKTALAFDRAQQGTVDKYVRQTLEEDTGERSEGARLALYFERAAPNIKSYYSILADPALLKVVQIAYSIPSETGALDIDKQADLFKSKFALTDLQDPDKLQTLLTRFTALYDATQTDVQSTSPTLALFGSSASGIDGNLLLTLQSYRNGGR